MIPPDRDLTAADGSSRTIVRLAYRPRTPLRDAQAPRDHRLSSGGDTVAMSEGVPGGQGWQRQLYDWLANPLLIAIVGSLLVYLVIPHLTRGWQNNAKILVGQKGPVGGL